VNERRGVPQERPLRDIPALPEHVGLVPAVDRSGFGTWTATCYRWSEMILWEGIGIGGPLPVSCFRGFEPVRGRCRCRS
jgi:hypothetical protein